MNYAISAHGTRANSMFFLLRFTLAFLLLFYPVTQMVDATYHDESAVNQSSKAIEETEKPTDEIYNLHNSDRLGLILVMQPLIASNYDSWSRSVVMALTAKNKPGFINGKCEIPEVDSAMYEKW